MTFRSKRKLIFRYIIHLAEEVGCTYALTLGLPTTLSPSSPWPPAAPLPAPPAVETDEEWIAKYVR